MARLLKKDDVLELMQRKQGKRNQRDFAKELGISQQYLGDVYLGRRDPGNKLLAALRLKKRVLYEPNGNH